jgi:phosphatidylserine/phosphatidylglycerophosphate/cardiolipin synthase-like enzyme
MVLHDQEFLPQAISLIDSSKRRIDIATFKAEITSRPRGARLRQFFELLYKKNSQGIEVNFLLNWNTQRRAAPRTNQYVIQELNKNKINVRILPLNRCCHAKIILVDQDKAIVGSHNLSVRSCRNNFEVSWIVEEPVALARLQAIYNQVLRTSIPAI